MNQDSIHVEKGRLEYDKLDDTYSHNASLEITSLQFAELDYVNYLFTNQLVAVVSHPQNPSLTASLLVV